MTVRRRGAAQMRFHQEHRSQTEQTDPDPDRAPAVTRQQAKCRRDNDARESNPQARAAVIDAQRRIARRAAALQQHSCATDIDQPAADAGQCPHHQQERVIGEQAGDEHTQAGDSHTQAQRDSRPEPCGRNADECRTQEVTDRIGTIDQAGLGIAPLQAIAHRLQQQCICEAPATKRDGAAQAENHCSKDHAVFVG
jgi:hypothetical protein